MNKVDVISQSIGKFFNFLKQNPKLTHLNLTQIELPDNLMQELIHYIKTSISLHVVHLCGNDLERCHSKIKNKLKPTFINRMVESNSTKKQLIDCMNKTLR